MSINFKEVEKEYGTLIVRSVPPYATVIVDSFDKINSISKMTPAIFDLIGREKPYRVTVKMEGYEDSIQKILIQKGTEVKINVVLTKLRVNNEPK